jgi:stage III sporulation protein AE
MEQSIEFMQTLIPVYCLVMVFASGSGMSLGFYQTAFVVIYIIQWIFIRFLIPLIHGYVLVEICDHYAAKRRLGGLSSLLKNIVEGSMKLSGMAVLALNVVQAIVLPARDALTGGYVARAVSLIPGIGNTVSGVTELLLGSGILLRNAVGAAALIVLFVIGGVPWIKLACMCLLYQVALAIAEPLADHRVVGCVRGVAEGSALYRKLLAYSMALFLLTVALATSSGKLLW